MNIIAIAGRSGSGKDLVATYLHKRYHNCWIEHFADPLKEACAAAFGIPLENFYNTSRKEKDDPFWEISPRKIAQFVGTEMFRDQIPIILPEVGSNFWVTHMSGKLAGHLPCNAGTFYNDDDTIIIPDLRFQNEYNYVTGNGGIIIRLTRHGSSDTVGIPGHTSEHEFDMPEAYHIGNNGTKEELYAEIEDVLTKSGIVLFTEQTTLVQR